MFFQNTNALFAALLLGLQRLEETGVLEDMLEGWTGCDDMSSACSRIVFN